MSKEKKRFFTYLIAPAVIFIITYWVYYRQSAQQLGDIYKHMQNALSLNLVLSVSHGGWHLVTWMLYAMLPISIESAAAASCAVFNALTAVIFIWMLERYMQSGFQTVIYPTIITLAALMVGPLYLRFYNPYYYLGQGTPNIWHNPTATAVKPFMMIVTVLTIDYWEEQEKSKKRKYAIYLAILLALSTYMKPSFLMAYAPVCFVYICVRLIRSRGRDFIRLVLDNLYFIPAFLIFLYQYIRNFIFNGVSNTEAGVAIAPFKVATLYAPSVLLSLILKMAFPILVILIWRKTITKDRLFCFSFWQFTAGLLTSWMLCETGKRWKSGNFGWGNILASSFLWLFCVIWYCRELKKDSPEILQGNRKLIVQYALPGVILVWHLCAGIASLPIYTVASGYLH